MLFVSKKSHEKLDKECIRLQNQVFELEDKLKTLQQNLDIVTDDNLELRNINDFYIKKYNDAKNIIRIMKNGVYGNGVIPEKCPYCDEVLIYNEYLHIGSCPQCKSIIKYKEN